MQAVPGKGTVVTDLSEIDRLAAQKLAATISDPDPEPVPAQPAPAQTLGITEEQLKAALASVAEQSRAAEEAAKNALSVQMAEMEAKIAALEAEKNNLANEKTEAEKKSADLAKVFNMLGHTATPVQAAQEETSADKANVGCHFNLSPNYSNSPEGAAKEFYELISKNSISKFRQDTSGNGSSYSIQGQNYDRIEARQFLAEKSLGGRTHKEIILNSMTSWGQGFGLFQGSNFNGRSVNAVQVAAELRGGFLDTLSAIMREENRPGFSFWQFCPARFNFQAGMGTSIQIPRTPYKAQPTNSDQRKLSGTGTWRDIDPGAQSVATGVVNAAIEEWGLGGSPASAPFGIPRFIQAYSMLDVYGAVQQLLFFDYASWEDLKIRELWEPASTIIYNDNGNPTTTVGDLASGDKGTITKEFLINLKAYIATQQVLALPDQSHILWLPARGVAQFKSSLSDVERILDPQAAKDLSNILNPSMLASGAGSESRISGYHGYYYGFHIFSDNNYAIGGSGTPGVTTRTIASASRLVRTGFVAGADSIGMGVGQDFTILTDDYLFGRGDRMIWTKWAGYAALDVDPTGYGDVSAIPQQRRVFKIEMLDAAI